ncbi:uncharacterized protein KY384_005087 [Bacidia gigantensis]|uniref:uncharacterized protein n=1 Tax=Bacidia gigantensis TaxID=2732470 RepID=UPI001D03B37A|nr:uncharacterized protein KY384_005087 [Bacidia gigantensis]KAG8530584.1 hypothetical protein KY384_005087 [Bacidia gigantensis]
MAARHRKIPLTEAQIEHKKAKLKQRNDARRPLQHENRRIFRQGKAIARELKDLIHEMTEGEGKNLLQDKLAHIVSGTKDTEVRRAKLLAMLKELGGTAKTAGKDGASAGRDKNTEMRDTTERKEQRATVCATIERTNDQEEKLPVICATIENDDSMIKQDQENAGETKQREAEDVDLNTGIYTCDWCF